MIARKKTPVAVLRPAAIFAAGITGLATVFSGSVHAQDAEVLTETEHDTVLAVVLAPDLDPGPPGAAEAPIAMEAPTPITLPDLAARIEAVTGRSIEIEDRPATVFGRHLAAGHSTTGPRFL